MSALVDCPGCMNGDHDKHVGPWNTRPGLIGGESCDCNGDCAERSEQTQREFVAMFGNSTAPPPAATPSPEPAGVAEALSTAGQALLGNPTTDPDFFALAEIVASAIKADFDGDPTAATNGLEEVRVALAALCEHGSCGFCVAGEPCDCHWPKPAPGVSGETRASELARALHEMTCEDNPGHRDWTDCATTGPCSEEGIRLARVLAALAPGPEPVCSCGEVWKGSALEAGNPHAITCALHWRLRYEAARDELDEVRQVIAARLLAASDGDA